MELLEKHIKIAIVNMFKYIKGNIMRREIENTKKSQQEIFRWKYSMYGAKKLDGMLCYYSTVNTAILLKKRSVNLKIKQLKLFKQKSKNKKDGNNEHTFCNLWKQSSTLVGK